MRWLRARLGSSEAGLTLVELLVASAMSVVIVGATVSMLISAVRTQPQISEQAQSISEARWVQERMTRELRNGVRIDEATSSVVSFVTQVRRTACGGATPLDEDTPAIDCQVTYDCSSGTACTRTEAAMGDLEGGTPRTLVTGIESSSVFNYSPSAADPTFVGIVLRVPNPRGPGSLTVSDGASLRTPILLSAG